MPAKIQHRLNGITKRYRPLKASQELILLHQKNLCFYCALPFDEWFIDSGLAKKRTPHWDHVSPYSLSFNSGDTNFVAACQLCNAIKHDKVFETIEEAIKHIRQRLVEKGYKPGSLQKTLTNSYESRILSETVVQCCNEPFFGDLNKEQLEAKLTAISASLEIIKKIEKANKRL